MALSGVKINDEIKTEYKEMFANQNEQNKNARPRYYVFKIDKNESGHKEITIDTKSAARKTGENSCREAYEEMSACFKPDVGRYVLFDFGDNEPCKPVLITWAPDTAKIGEKMLYASSKQPLVELVKNAVNIHGSEPEEVTYESVSEIVDKNKEKKKL